MSTSVLGLGGGSPGGGLASLKPPPGSPNMRLPGAATQSSGGAGKMTPEQQAMAARPQTAADYLEQSKGQAAIQQQQQAQQQAEQQKAQLEIQRAQLDMEKTRMDMQNQQLTTSSQAQATLRQSQPPPPSDPAPAFRMLSSRLQDINKRVSQIKPTSRPEMLVKLSNASTPSPAESPLKTPDEPMSWKKILGTVGNQATGLLMKTEGPPLRHGPVTKPTAISQFYKKYTGELGPYQPAAPSPLQSMLSFVNSIQQQMPQQAS